MASTAIATVDDLAMVVRLVVRVKRARPPTSPESSNGLSTGVSIKVFKVLEVFEVLVMEVRDFWDSMTKYPAKPKLSNPSMMRLVHNQGRIVFLVMIVRLSLSMARMVGGFSINFLPDSSCHFDMETMESVEEAIASIMGGAK